MITVVSEVTGISELDILEQRKVRKAVRARRLYFKLLREYGYTDIEISELSEANIGVVRHGIHEIEKDMKMNLLTKQMWEDIIYLADELGKKEK